MSSDVKRDCLSGVAMMTVARQTWLYHVQSKTVLLGKGIRRDTFVLAPPLSYNKVSTISLSSKPAAVPQAGCVTGANQCL